MLPINTETNLNTVWRWGGEGIKHSIYTDAGQPSKMKFLADKEAAELTRAIYAINLPPQKKQKKQVYHLHQKRNAKEVQRWEHDCTQNSNQATQYIAC